MTTKIIKSKFIKYILKLAALLGVIIFSIEFAIAILMIIGGEGDKGLF